MRFLAFITFLLFCVFLFFARWYYVCQVKQACEPIVEVQEDIRLKELQLKEYGEVILNGYDEFAFAKGAISPRLNANNQSFLDTLATILSRDSSKNLTITAFYRENEMDIQPGYFESIGIARADSIRLLLLANGIKKGRITLEDGISEDSLLQKPLLFELYDGSNLDEYAKLEFTFTNMTFSDANFKFNSDEFNPGKPFLLYADSLKTYLNLHNDKKLRIIGHTDKIGKTKYNKNLGLRRAKNTKKYLEDSLNISSPIDVESKGESEPVATNKTKKGRQKNRRVNFVIE